MRFKVGVFGVIVVLCIQSVAQIAHPGIPYSKQLVSDSIISVYENIHGFDMQKIFAEDAVTDMHKDISWRFGLFSPVSIDLKSQGTKRVLANGDKIWRIKIHSSGAKSINLNYSHFDIPVGAKLYVYSENSKQVLGAFTHENVKESKLFATMLVQGETCIVEYNEPSSVAYSGKVEIGGIVHGYRGIGNLEKDFGDSGSCHRNAVCEEKIWGNEIRSIVLTLVSSNSRLCTGTLVNNTRNDGTPYVITGKHCQGDATNIFVFNYKSSSCLSTLDGSLSQSIVGATKRAELAPTDFDMYELSSIPPVGYNVFYAGWNWKNVAPLRSTGLHHPVHDVMKISFDHDEAVSTNYPNNGQSNSTYYWGVKSWDISATQGGSSGSGLFNEKHQFVGQLHGGAANCGNKYSDYYGKLNISWKSSPDISAQAKHWLDPDDTGLDEIAGYDPNSPTKSNDALLSSIIEPDSFICGVNSVIPKVVIRNVGASTLTSLNIKVMLDGNLVLTKNWLGTLKTFEAEVLTLNNLIINGGSHTLKVFVENPNNTIDEDVLNDTIEKIIYKVPNPINYTHTTITDGYGGETNWYIVDNGNQQVIEVFGAFKTVAGGQTISDNVCLEEDRCYDVILADVKSFPDGFSPGGSLVITHASPNTSNKVVEDNTFNGSKVTHSFCAWPASIEEISTSTIKIYPQPATDEIRVSIPLLSKNYEEISFEIYSVQGKKMTSFNEFVSGEVVLSLSNLSSGTYILKGISNKIQFKKLFKIVK